MQELDFSQYLSNIFKSYDFEMDKRNKLDILKKAFNKEASDFLHFNADVDINNNYNLVIDEDLNSLLLAPMVIINKKTYTSNIYEGYHVSLIFKPDMTGFYLALNQGFNYFDIENISGYNLRKISKYWSNNLILPASNINLNSIKAKTIEGLLERSVIASVEISLSNPDLRMMKQEFGKMFKLLNKIIVETNYDWKSENEAIILDKPKYGLKKFVVKNVDVEKELKYIVAQESITYNVRDHFPAELTHEEHKAIKNAYARALRAGRVEKIAYYNDGFGTFTLEFFDGEQIFSRKSLFGDDTETKIILNKFEKEFFNNLESTFAFDALIYYITLVAHKMF